MKQNLNLCILSGALLSVVGTASAAGIYDNNISAININMLTDTFMSYTDYGTNMSDLFVQRRLYGTMDRFDEYGDDGSTLKIKDSKDSTNRSLLKNIWINANHIDGDLHYGNSISERGRFNLATIGATSRASELKYGKISFGGFLSYINTKLPEYHGNGDAFGFFADYKYRKFNAKFLGTIGSLNNNANGVSFNNSWVGVATDFAGTFRIDDTLYIRPNIYGGYTFVASDDLYLNNKVVSSSDYHFFNVAPGVAFIKEISPNWYGKLSAKYIAHFGGKNDIDVAGTKTDGLKLDNHTDIGIDIEYNFRQFVFGANIHKQIGGVDGLSGNLNIKYIF